MDKMLSKTSKKDSLQNEEQWKDHMDQVNSLQKLLTAKDIFLRTYTNFMRYRLLEENSIGEDFEGYFIDLLKSEGTDDLIRSIQGMKREAFPNEREDLGQPAGTDYEFKCKVLSQTNWSQNPDEKFQKA